MSDQSRDGAPTGKQTPKAISGRGHSNRGSIGSARAQLAAIAGGVSERTRRYGIKQQPMGQRPPKQSNIDKG